MVIFSNFAINFAFSASLNQLWALINTQQLIVLMPLFKVNIPANAGMFFAKIMQIAAFELVEIEEWLNSFLELEPTGPINKNFGALGLDSFYLINNMSTLVLAFAILIRSFT